MENGTLFLEKGNSIFPRNKYISAIWVLDQRNTITLTVGYFCVLEIQPFCSDKETMFRSMPLLDTLLLIVYKLLFIWRL